MKKENVSGTYRRIVAEMEKAGLDYLWISSPENHFYSTGFVNPDGRVLIGTEQSYMYADFRYIEQARENAIPEYEVIMPEAGILGALRETAADFGEIRLGYEEDNLSCAERDEIAKIIPGAKFVPFGEMMTILRSVKRDDEIEQIIAAQKITDAAFSYIINVIKPDMTELEVAAELEYFMKKNGADDKSFDTISVSGKNSSSPHRVPENRKLERGFLTMDFGALVGCYHADMTRTVCIGKADDEMKRMYNTVLKAQLAALEAIAPGKNNREMDKIARDIIDGTEGYKGAFGHSLGHGVGLLIHEAPNLSMRVSPATFLVPGNVVTCEPGIYLAGKYGCRIEDMVVIRDGYAEDITHSTKELIEL